MTDAQNAARMTMTNTENTARMTMPDGARATQSAPGPEKRSDASPRFSRSRQMGDCLRNELLYSEKRPRDILFRAIERIVWDAAKTGEPKIVSRVTREAATLARHRAEESGFEFGPWETTSKAVVKAMLCAGVLLNARGEAIPADITAQATPVAALRDDYRNATEAFLLRFLIERLGDVTTRDHTALAHVLFRQFDRGVPLEDLEDRVVILLAQLAGYVELSGDVYSLRVPPSARGAPPPYVNAPHA